MNIRIRYSDDSLFGHNDPDDEGINAIVSRAQFEEALVNAFYDEYPKAEIEIVHGINDDHSVDGQHDTVECEYVGNLINKVWDSWEWIEYNEEVE